MNLSEREEAVINALEEMGPMSFTEIKNHYQQRFGREKTPFRHNPALARPLNSLLEKKFIEKKMAKQSTRYRYRYHITKIYQNRVKEQQFARRQKKSIIFSKKWYIINARFKNYLDNSYPDLKLINERLYYSFLIDCISYIHALDSPDFNFNENFRRKHNLVTYLVMNHADNKYRQFQKIFSISRRDIDGLLAKLLADGRISKFKWLHPEMQLKNHESTEIINCYLIRDDPVLYNFRQQLETIFSYHFLPLWRYSKISLEGNFDFIIQFASSVFYNLFQTEKKRDTRILLKNNAVLFHLYSMNRIMDYLENPDEKMPFQLLSHDEKRERAIEILTNEQLITESELSDLSSFLMIKKEQSSIPSPEFYDIFKTLIDQHEAAVYKNRKLWFKSHMLRLLRILHRNVQGDRIAEFKTRISSESKYTSYSRLSKEVWQSIKEDFTLILEKNPEYGRSFIRTNMIERIDHLKHTYQKKENKEKVKKEIHEIFQLAQEKFKSTEHFPFNKKKIELYRKFGSSLFSIEDTINSVKYLMKQFPYNASYFDDMIHLNDAIENPNLLHEFFEKIPYDYDLRKFLAVKKASEFPSYIDLNAYFKGFESEIARDIQQYKFIPGHDDFFRSLLILISRKPQDYSTKIMLTVYLHYLVFFNKHINHLSDIINLNKKSFQKYIEEPDISAAIIKEQLDANYMLSIIVKNFFFETKSLLSNLENVKLFGMEPSELLQSKDSENSSDIKNAEDDHHVKLYKIIKDSEDIFKFLLQKIAAMKEGNFDKQSNFLSEYRVQLKKLGPEVTSEYQMQIFAYFNEVKAIFKDGTASSGTKTLEYPPRTRQDQDIMKVASLTHDETSTPFISNEDQDLHVDKDYLAINDEYDFKLAFNRIYNIPKIEKRWLTQSDDTLQYPVLFKYHLSLFNEFSSASLPVLNLVVSTIHKTFSLDWSIKYLNLYIRYVKWYNSRNNRDSILLGPNRFKISNMKAFLETLKNLVLSNLYWMHRDRNQSKQFFDKYLKNVDRNNDISHLFNQNPVFKCFSDIDKKLNQEFYSSKY